MKNNVDAQSLSQFDALAKHWWDENGPLKTLHDINPCRMSFIQQYADLGSETTVLDVGCGGGILTESLAKSGATVTGIDASQSAIAVAQSHAKAGGLSIDYQVSTLENFKVLRQNTGQNTFEVITCLELLEHVPHPEQLVRLCAEHLKPGGVLFFSTLNRTLKAYALAILGAEYLLKLIPKGTHAYQQFIRPSELEQWANATQLKLIRLSGMHYNPFSRKASLSQDLQVNYLACYTRG